MRSKELRMPRQIGTRSFLQGFRHRPSPMLKQFLPAQRCHEVMSISPFHPCILLWFSACLKTGGPMWLDGIQRSCWIQGGVDAHILFNADIMLMFHAMHDDSIRKLGCTDMLRFRGGCPCDWESKLRHFPKAGVAQCITVHRSASCPEDVWNFEAPRACGFWGLTSWELLCN